MTTAIEEELDALEATIERGLVLRKLGRLEEAARSARRSALGSCPAATAASFSRASLCAWSGVSWPTEPSTWRRVARPTRNWISHARRGEFG